MIFLKLDLGVKMGGLDLGLDCNGQFTVMEKRNS